MHLAKRDTGFLEDILFLDATTDQVRFEFFDELLQFELGDVIVDQGALGHLRCSAVVVILMGKFVTGAGDLDTEIFVGPDGMTRAQATDK